MNLPWLVALELLGRWAHVVAGIAWIGSSFYFIWLDNHLEAPREGGGEGVAGELWSVHGGGLYRAQKLQVFPRVPPHTLHWFKWEAYATWITGMFLFGLIYASGAQLYLIDPGVAVLSAPTAILVSILILPAGWLAYDLTCRSPLGGDDRALAVALLLLCGVLAWGLCRIYGGRGAFLLFGAVLGTIMVANVLFVIIPGQRAMLDVTAPGEPLSGGPGARGKQRSVHNTYFTLPVLFTMTSNHYPLAWNHPYNWLVLIAIALAGTLVRVHFVARHKGRGAPLALAGSLLLAVCALAILAPRSDAHATARVSLDEVRDILDQRCRTCHSATPSYEGVAAAPAGLAFDTPDEIVRYAPRIHQQAVVTRAMPTGNLTRISESERSRIDAWYRARERDG